MGFCRGELKPKDRGRAYSSERMETMRPPHPALAPEASGRRTAGEFALCSTQRSSTVSQPMLPYSDRLQDTVRESVLRQGHQLTGEYPIQEVWPVLQLDLDPLVTDLR